MYSGTYALAILIITSAWLPTGSKKTITRPNFGVVLVPQGQLVSGHSYWTQVFEYHLEQLDELRSHISKPQCAFVHKTVCNQTKDLIDVLNEIRSNSFRQAQNLMSDITTLMEEPWDHDTSDELQRRKKAILGFVGNWLSSIFGFVGPETAAKLDRHMHNLVSAQQLQQHEIQRLSNDFLAYTKVTKEHFTQAESAFGAIGNITKELEYEIQLEHVNMSLLHNGLLMISQIQRNSISTTNGLFHLELLLSDIRSGLHTLFAGYLPQEFVSVSEIQSAIDRINAQLQDQGQGYSILFPSPAYYYHIKDIAFTVQNGSLFISIDFPIANIDAEYRLYSIKVVPVPVSDEGNSTQILDLPSFLAISRRKHYFIELNDLTHCTPGPILLCPVSPPARSIEFPTCSVALFVSLISGTRCFGKEGCYRAIGSPALVVIFRGQLPRPDRS